MHEKKSNDVKIIIYPFEWFNVFFFFLVEKTIFICRQSNDGIIFPFPNCTTIKKKNDDDHRRKINQLISVQYIQTNSKKHVILFWSIENTGRKRKEIQQQQIPKQTSLTITAFFGGREEGDGRESENEEIEL